MTIILSLVGLIVFVASLFTVGFKKAFWRMAAFIITGFMIDVLIGTFIAVMTYASLN